MSTKIGDLAVYISANVGPLARDLARGSAMVSQFAGGISRQMAAAAAPLSSFARDLGAIAGGNLLASGIRQAVGGMSDLVAGSIKLAAEAEATDSRFESLLGSMKAARKLTAEMRSFAAESPVGLGAANDAATRLLGAEIKPDQIAPTLRALTDLAMGDTEQMKSLVKVYTQVKAMGKLTGGDWLQFASVGTLSLKDLGKAMGVTEDQVLKLREKGEVSFRDLQKAIKGATEEGGRFAGLGEKYAQTFAGRLDKLSDAWDDVKRTFGSALIEEWGLKAAADDVGTFMDRVKGYVNDLRPTLKLVGEVGKGLVQVLAEGGRAAGLVAGAAADIFGKRFPETVKAMRDGVADLQNFKFGPLAAVRLGVSIAEGISGAIEAVRPLWRDFTRDFVVPIRDAIADLRALKDGAGTRFLNFGALVTRQRGEVDAVRAMRANDLAAEGRISALADRHRLGTQDAYNLDQFQSLRADAQKALDAVRGVEVKTADDAALRLVKMTALADEIRNYDASIAGIMKRSGSATDYLDPIRRYAADLERRDKYDRDRAAFFKNLDAGTKAEARPLVRALAEALPGGLFSPLGGSFLGFAGRQRDRVALDDSFPARLSDLAGKLNEKFVDPVARYGKELADLTALRDAGKITGDVYALAFADVVKELGGGGGPIQLPAAAELGSQQLASMVATAGVGTGPATVEGLLKMLNDQMAENVRAAQELVAQGRAKPPVVTMTE